MIRSAGNRPCTACARPTAEPRRGMCFACYQRARRGHVASSACAVCATADRRVLRRHQLVDGWTVLCANHAAVAGRRSISLLELRAEVSPEGDRRAADRRREDRRSPAQPRRARVDVDRLLLESERREVGRRGADAA